MRRPTTTVTSTLLVIIMITTTTADPPPPYSHNITAILATYPQFTIFNHHLTATGLSDIINNLTEVTVCAMDDSAMSSLLSLNSSPSSLRRLLLFHLFSHYSDDDYLNSCCAWTLYPRPSGSGHEVVDLMTIDAKTSFTFPFTSDYSQLLEIVKLVPPHLSILHVSNVLPSPEHWSLTSPIETLKIMGTIGCRAFARAVAEVTEAEKWFRENAYVGMTVICPVDKAWERFMPRFEAMKEEERVDLLLFHAIPVYHRRCEFIGGEMGEWRVATLASYYRGNGGFGEPTMDMAAVGRLVVGVGYDEGPLAVYPIRGVLLPDDPIGAVEYSDLAGEMVMEEECDTGLGFFPTAPAPQPSVMVDSGLVEENNVVASYKLA